MVIATEPLTEAEVRLFVYEWYEGLSNKDPLAQMRARIAADGLEMKFPDTTLRSVADFESWYATVTNAFFNQAHIIESCEVSLDGGAADLKVKVRWETDIWKPPAARSHREAYESGQTWRLVRGPAGAPVIRHYSVDTLEPAAFA
jgi:hypothetical protein